MWAGTQQLGNEWCEIVVEIDTEENRDNDLQKLFLVKVLKRATADTKVGKKMVVGNLFLKLKIFK